MITYLTNTFEPYCVPESPSGFVELDMGCGKGLYTLALGERYPERTVLASDVMHGRLRRLNNKVEKRHLTNVHLLRASSLELISFQLEPQSVDRIHLLCPDPWPKEHHRVKRLVTHDFLCRLPRVLKVGGVLHMSTDHAPYFMEWLKMMEDITLFEPAPNGASDMEDVKTDFELQWNAQGIPVQHACWRLVRTW